MKDRDQDMKEFLQDALKPPVTPVRMEETISRCTEIMREQAGYQREARSGFWQFLSDVFRFEGPIIFGLQTAVLLLICALIGAMDEALCYIPAFMPLFALAVVPVIFRSSFYHMSEMEAVTRASGAEIILAKLILVGAANLVCATAVFFLEVRLQNPGENMGRMILHGLVPYLVCMTAILRLVRLQKRKAAKRSAAVAVCSCMVWGMTVQAMPGLYETSATGLWIFLSVVFTVFFIREIYFIWETRKEGRQYGIIV